MAIGDIPLRKQYHSVTFGDKNSWDDWHLVPTTRPVINPPPVKKVTVDVPGMDGVLDLSEVVSGRPVYGNRTGSIKFHVETDFAPLIPQPGIQVGDRHTVDHTDSWWTILENGSSKQNSRAKIVCFQVEPLSTIYVKPSPSNVIVYQNNTYSVTSNVPNPRLVGEPIIDGTEGLYTVPEGATWICFGAPANDDEVGVYDYTYTTVSGVIGRYPDQQNWQYTFSIIMSYIHGKRMRMILEDDPEYYYEGRFEVDQWKSDKEYSLITINYDVGPFRRKVSDGSNGGL